MSLLLLMLLSIIPGVLWVNYFAKNDRNREPPRMLVRTFLFGMLAIVPAALLEQPLRFLLLESTTLSWSIVLALFAIGVIEEGVKLGATYVAVFHSSHFDEVADGIVYAITAALGFAAVENLFYTATFGLAVAPIRAVITSLAHASFAGVYGFWLGLYKLGRASLGDLWRGFTLSATLHAFYDLIVVSQAVPPWLAILMVIYVYRYVIGKLRSLAEIG